MVQIRAISIFVLCSISYIAHLEADQFSLHKYSNSISRNPRYSIDFIRLPQIPRRLRHNLPFHMEYRCSQDAFIHIDVCVLSELQKQVMVFHRQFNCTADESEVKEQVVRLQLPPYLAYRPSRWNKYSVFVEKAIIKVWMTRNQTYRPKCQLYPNKFVVTSEKIMVEIDQPFERMDRPWNGCPTWWQMVEASWPWNPQCAKELEVFPLVTFPLALNGAKTGVNRIIPDFQSRVLRNHNGLQWRQKPRFTLVFWLYVVDFCPSGNLCSIFHHISWDDKFATPIVYINQKGQLHLEVIMENAKSKAFLTVDDFLIPRQEWFRLTITAYPYHQPWQLYLNYGPTFELKATNQIILNWDTPAYNDSSGVFVVGGSEWVSSFKGYVGEAVLYRTKSLLPHEIPLPSKSHPMFLLGLAEKESEERKCTRDIKTTVFQSRLLLEEIMRNKTCSNVVTDIFLPPITTSNASSHAFHGLSTQQQSRMRNLVKKNVLNGRTVSLEKIREELFKDATHFLEEDDRSEEVLKQIKAVRSQLEECSCLGNHDASHFLSVILSNGVAVGLNESESNSYLLIGAMNGHRESLMSLANKHFHGLDSIPNDFEQAYVYYKDVADRTRLDMDTQDKSGALVEMIRLTSEVEVEAQTEEMGDLFVWLSHQARKGILDAQHSVAQMLYWGRQGIKRNMNEAAKFYKMSASSGDPTALYNYAIVLLKGHGIEKNMTMAVENLEKAAKHQHPESLNTLGWHALEIEKNASKAAHFFNRAYRLGNYDAAYNLGHMHLAGIYPGGRGADREKAWSFIFAAATHGQLEAGLVLAMYYIRGHPAIKRDAKVAAEWARYLAERNPAAGNLLSQGLKAYRAEHWSSAFLYYLMASSSGLEVANFNAAFLCDENYGNVTSLMERECKWRFYNLSTQRATKDVNSYAWIKMAEYYYFGVNGTRDLSLAAEMYTNAAHSGDPRGIFSLASLVEEGFVIPDSIWKKLKIQSSDNQFHMLKHLYTRCLDSPVGEAFVPCSLALYRIQLLDFYQRYNAIIMAVLVILFSTIIFTSTVGLLCLL